MTASWPVEKNSFNWIEQVLGTDLNWQVLSVSALTEVRRVTILLQ